MSRLRDEMRKDKSTVPLYVGKDLVNIYKASLDMYEALKVADTAIHNSIRYEPAGAYRKQFQQYLIQIREALAKAEGK